MSSYLLGAVGLVSFITGWVGRTVTFRFRRPLLSQSKDQDIAQFMGAVVNLEELEQTRRKLHRERLQTGRRTVRFDGGENAQVHRMRKVRRTHPQNP